MSELRTDSSYGATSGPVVGTGTDSTGRASQVADDNNVHYNPGDHRFEITLDGKPTTISPLEAVCYVLQNRYIAMSDSVAERTQEMQNQVNEINEANDWLNAIKTARDGNALKQPGTASASLQHWMDQNQIDFGKLGEKPEAGSLETLESQFSSHVDQLSSTNDLKMLGLKTVVNKAQEALTAADGVLQDIKQLMQTITNNMAR